MGDERRIGEQGPKWSEYDLIPVEQSLVISPAMVKALREIYQLDWNGIHGYSHWLRVRENGLRLAHVTGADAKIVELFAFLHDSHRRNDRIDPGHGRRAADYVDLIRGDFFDLADDDLELLKFACAHHTDGLVEADVTVQVCWDSDRLDLGRVGIRPHARYLCTSTAQQPDMIEWAFRRSRKWLSHPSLGAK